MADTDTIPEADLEVVSKQGKPPKTRLTSSSSAWNIFKKVRNQDQERDRKRALIKKQLDGNRPYSQAELIRLGQAHRSNVNFRDAEGIRDARKTSYYELLMEVETLVKIKIKGFTDPVDPDKDWGEVIAEKFTEMLTSWEGWWYHMMLHQEQLVTWGVGNVYWENEIDWRFKAARVGSFLVPDETKSTLEDFDVIPIRDIYRVHDLFQYVKDDETTKASQEAGWNTRLVIDLIRKTIEKKSDSDSHALGEWSSIQQKIKDNDIEYSYGDYENIRIVHMFVKEYDGKISHFIISEDEEFNKPEDDNPDRFIFKDVGQFGNWHQAIGPFMANIGDGTYHSIRGLGAKIFAHCQLMDRMKNTLMDGAMASATILLQPNNEGQRERLRMVRYGPFSVMPNGYSVITDRAHRNNFGDLISVDAFLKAGLHGNIGMYRPDVVEDDKTPQGRNMQEERNRASKEAKLEKSDIHIYYICLDGLYNEIMRRVTSQLTTVDPGYKEAQAFLKACKDAGVPPELLKYDRMKVSARRAIGYGSPTQRSMVTADVLSISPYFDERGKNNAVRDYVLARTGVAGVDRYIPSIDRNMIPTTQHTLANLENNDMREGQGAIVGEDQPHVIHLLVHMRDMVRDAQAYIQGQYQGSPETLYTFLSQAIPHCAQHLDYIMTDPSRENEYQLFAGQLQELAKVYKSIENEVTQRQKEAEAQARAQAEVLQQAAQMAEGQELEIKLQEIQKDFEFKMFKEMNMQKIREEKARHGMAIDEMVARHQVSNTGGKG